MKMKTIRSLQALSVLLLAVWVIGCATPVPGANPGLLQFLEPGKTRREEVLLKLGQPSAAFEQDKILTYRIGEDTEHGRYVISPKAALPWQSVQYSLVLVFDPQGVLQKQSLVSVQ